MQLNNKLAGALLAAMVLLMTGAFAILRSDSATIRGNEMNVDRAVFNVANAATLTGFQLAVNVNNYKPPGQQAIFALIAAASLVTLIVGGCALAKIVQMRCASWQIALASLVVWIVAVLLGASLLLRPNVGTWPAIFQSASAFGNDGHVVGDLPGLMDWRLHLVLLPLGL